MKTIGIKLADGSFYPVLEEGTKEQKQLDLTTAHNNQTRVMVDMYRSVSCSMEDAEYVDTLQIDNLVAHPNGQPDISFTVSLDDDNNLFAKIVDEETGAQSKTTITLVSRTIEERLITDDYEIKENKESMGNSLENVEGTEKSKESAGGLLAAAMLINEQDAAKELENADTLSVETGLDSLDDITSDVSLDMEPTDITADIFSADDLDINIDDMGVETEVADASLETTSEDSLDLDLPDFDSGDSLDGSTESEANDSLDLDLGDFSVESVESTDSQETDSLDLDMPDLNLDDNFTTSETPDASLETSSEDSLDLDLPDFDSGDSFDGSTESNEVSEDDFGADLPDLDMGDISAGLTESESTDSLDTDLSDFNLDDDTTALESSDSLDLDMSDIGSTDSEVNPFDTDDMDLDTNNSATDDSYFDDLSNIKTDDSDSLDDIDPFATDTDTSLDTSISDDDLFSSDDSVDSIQPSGGGISFTGLYDNTDLGDDTEVEAPKNRKLTTIVICLVSILLFAAVLSCIFIIPSKSKGKKKKAKKAVKIEQVIEQVEEEANPEYLVPPVVEEETPVPVEEKIIDTPITDSIVENEPEDVPQAKEDEIVVIVEAEKVVPELPPVEVEKPADICYKVKWGDTLWDIANTYYKNPWKYKYLARYNGIKNPDSIVSGTYLYIPAE